MILLSLEAGVLEGVLRACTEVLLAERASVLSNVCVLLYDLLAKSFNASAIVWRLTNCSLSGTFLSFILWTPALADPSSAAAATADVYFMMAGTQSPTKQYDGNDKRS